MNDGDKALVVQDDVLTEVAERNMEGIVPLYYEMGVADSETITNEKIYDSLLLAFKANIGEVSNNITKVMNGKKVDLDVVKWLTAENNYMIDYAKTLYMPERPQWVDERIRVWTRDKVPYFFIDAKDKEKKNVEPINNSVVNRLRKIIVSKRIDFEGVAGEFDYQMLMEDPVTYSNRDLVKKYKELNRNKRFSFNTKEKTTSMYNLQYIREELLEIASSPSRVTDILVDYIYTCTRSQNMTTMWDSFGREMVSNLKSNLKDTSYCSICGGRFNKSYKTSVYCSDKCAREAKLLMDRKNYLFKKNRAKKAL